MDSPCLKRHNFSICVKLDAGLSDVKAFKRSYDNPKWNFDLKTADLRRLMRPKSLRFLVVLHSDPVRTVHSLEDFFQKSVQ